MASPGWLRGVRTGLSLRSRTRSQNPGIRSYLGLGLESDSSANSCSGFGTRRTYQAQAQLKGEDEDGEEEFSEPIQWQIGGEMPSDSGGRAPPNPDWKLSYSRDDGLRNFAPERTKDNPLPITISAMFAIPSMTPLSPSIPSSTPDTASHKRIIPPPRTSTPSNVPAPRSGKRSGEVDFTTYPALDRPDGFVAERKGQQRRRGSSDGQDGKEKAVEVEVEDLDEASPTVQAARLVIQALHPSTYASSPTESVPASTLVTIFQKLHDDHLEGVVRARRKSRSFLHASTARVPPTLQASLDLLDALCAVRKTRQLKMYEILINHCVIARRPDLAATVYVGLVEEWIMEGRLAEGGHPEEFREGGGPIALAQSREEEEQEKIKYSMAAEVNGWFEGVRSWRFPGEKLTPSQRLDLWHPRKLALHEKLKGFPVPSPTSPPTLTPQPNLDCLKRVLAGVKLDCYEEDRLLYERSARALATLANTVLSRTLPIMGLGCLLDAFERIHYTPEVFPEGFVPPPDCTDTYPYTAYAHTYRANMSLTLFPPVFAKNARVNLATLYRLPPLNTQSCNRLIHWVMTVVKRPSYRVPLWKYMKHGGRGFARLNAVTYNTVFRGATLLRDNALAEEVRTVLFGATATQAVPVVQSGSPATDGTAGFFVHNVQVPTRQTRTETAIRPDEFSMSTNIAFLTATNRFEEIVEIAYKIYPFLDTDRYPILGDSATTAEIELERARREALVDKVTQYSGHTFCSILHALRSCSRVNLATRLYTLGKRADQDSKLGWRMPIEAYTTMMEMYAEMSDRVGLGRMGDRKDRVRKVFREAFTAIGNKENHDARLEAFRASRASEGPGKMPVPDVKFFEAFLRSVDLADPVIAPEPTDLDLRQAANRASLSLFQLEMVVYTAELWELDIPAPWLEQQTSFRTFLSSIKAKRERLHTTEPIRSLSVDGQDPEPSTSIDQTAGAPLDSGVKLTTLVRTTESWLWPEFRQSLDQFLPKTWGVGTSGSARRTGQREGQSGRRTSGGAGVR